MFGTDHPFTDTGVQRIVEAIEAMDVPDEAKVKVCGGMRELFVALAARSYSWRSTVVDEIGSDKL